MKRNLFLVIISVMFLGTALAEDIYKYPDYEKFSEKYPQRFKNIQHSLLNNKEYKDLLVSNYTYSNGWYQYLVNNQFYLGHEGSNGPFYARALICKGLFWLFYQIQVTKRQ